MSKFKVGDTFSIADRKVFVLSGSIIEGNISVGMHIQPTYEGASALVISNIEMLRKVDGRKLVGVCIRYQNDEELKSLKDSGFQDTIIEIK